MKLNALYLLTFGIIALISCKSNAAEQESQITKPIPIIFETDIGNDVDDALALDMLYKYLDDNKVNLLGISINKNSPYSAPFTDILNTWYGYPDIPVSVVSDGVNSDGDSKDYAQTIMEYNKGGFKFTGSHSPDFQYPESVGFYRKTLAEQPDSSVVIVSVGFSTNLSRLLESKADKYSGLNGTELVAKKVKLLSVMAGCFNNSVKKEYNVFKDIRAAQQVFKDWPTKIMVSPFELGASILYPATVIENNFKWSAHNPVVIAYESYLKMPHDRPTWDLTALLYAVEGTKDGSYFSVSNKGDIAVDDSGATSFTENKNGLRQYLKIDSVQRENIKGRLIELTTHKPLKYRD